MSQDGQPRRDEGGKRGRMKKKTFPGCSFMSLTSTAFAASCPLPWSSTSTRRRWRKGGRDGREEGEEGEKKKSQILRASADDPMVRPS